MIYENEVEHPLRRTVWSRVEMPGRRLKARLLRQTEILSSGHVGPVNKQNCTQRRRNLPEGCLDKCCQVCYSTTKFGK